MGPGFEGVVVVRPVPATIYGMSTDRERLAASIDAACERTPSLPSNVPATDAARSYMVHRLAEVLAIWEAHDVHPLGVVVSCSRDLAAKVMPLHNVSGVPVEINPLSQREAYGYGANTFTMEIDADDPATVWVRPSVGIAYDGPVDPEIFATRWVLQEVDGMDDTDAEEASRRL